MANKILVIGGGFSGMSAAIMMARGGIAVDLVEIDAGWRSYGAGISLHGATLRALDTLGVLDDFREVGAMNTGLVIRKPHNDEVVATIPTPPMPGTGLPGNAAIMRPDLAKILSKATLAAGVNVRLGLSFSAIAQDDDGVDVTFTDGTSARYDAVIGADGLFSATRAAIMPNAPKPAYVGQAVWRAVLDTPAEITSLNMWMTKGLKAGVNPVSPTRSYMFLTEDKPENSWMDEATLVDTFNGLLARFPSPILSRIAEGITADSQVIYRPIERLLVQQPWSVGRVLLIGDAVHATTPHLGAGALIGIEDGIVIAEELLSKPVLEAFAAHEARRWERCRMVVENSGRLSEIEITGGDQGEHNMIMGKSAGALTAPI